MDELLRVLHASDWVAAERVIREWGRDASPTQEEMLSLLMLAPMIRRQFDARSIVEGSCGPITWYGYESVLWTMGEAFRQILKRQPHLCRSPDLLGFVGALCLDPIYGKGRESFTMLLGHYGGLPQAPQLIALLSDSEVDGHALLALRKLGIAGGREKALSLLADGKGWKRQEARKYLRKLYPDHNGPTLAKDA